jgi:hypothetical protein
MNTEFETVVLNELSRAWSNHVYKFKWGSSGITPPNFRITEASVSHWGQWDAGTREMHFSRHLVTTRPWNEVLEVLKHEMAHQYVSEVLHMDTEVSHGPTFQSVCKQYQIDAAARGIPGANQLTTTNHIVEKIQNLLKLAENVGATEGEKQNAAEAAHNMMLKYNIELQAKNEERGYTVRYLGGITGRIQAYMSEAANLLQKYYFVELIWMSTYDPRSKKKGHELEVSGREENVEVAEYVYDFLTRAAVESWEAKMADPAFKLQLHHEFAKSWGRSSSAPQSVQGFTISARSNFLIGFVQGFKDQLKKAAYKEQEAGLVLARDPGLEEFYKERHPHVRHLHSQGAYHQSGMRGLGHAEGSSLKIPPAAKAGKHFVPLLGK